MSRMPLDSVTDIAAVAQRVDPTRVPPHRSHDPDNNLKRSDPFQFGSRFLEEGDDVFEFNAWDHVEPDDEYRAFAEVQYARQRETPVSEFDRHRFNTQPAKWWDLFYKNNTANFFKNRKWLCQEFPILAEATRRDAGPRVILEVGAGAGNTAFPLLLNNSNEQLRIHACDFSKVAVQVMRESEHYDPRYITADVWDVAATEEGQPSSSSDSSSSSSSNSSSGLPPGLSEESVDVVILIFIFSALAPDQWDSALRNVHRLLKPGGQVLFRDYGRGDLAQVRFKKHRYMADNFYVRGDGTRVYFFDRAELEQMWRGWSPKRGLHIHGGGDVDVDDVDVNGNHEGDLDADEDGQGDSGAFEILKLGIDRRLVVNRQKKLKMHRCWMQGHFRKRPAGVASSLIAPSSTAESALAESS